MPRPTLACLHVPALPLQLVLLGHPEWAGQPAGVVERDTPQGRLTWVSEAARRRRILPGMRYVQALALEGEFVAQAVSEEEIAAAVAELEQGLQALAPAVEPAEREPGIFWLSGHGLARLWPDSEEWARTIRAAVEERGSYRATSVVAGFTRFGTYAIARVRRGVVILSDSESERRAARRVPLGRLGLDPESRQRLARLGVETVGELLRLPAADVGERYGGAIYALHRQASAADFAPPQGEPPEEPLARCFGLEDAEENTERLLFLVKRLLDPLLERLAESRRELAGLILVLALEDGSRRRETVRPAAPTLESARILELVRLRLANLDLSSRVEEVELEVGAREASSEQLELFPVASRRDLEAANRALARVRAELGRETVLRARLADKHLPEAAFLWEPMGRLESPAPEGRPPLRLVRRILASPQPLPPQSHHLRDDGWLIRGVGDGAVVRLLGPYILSGGWWGGREAERHYHFAETRGGELLWVFLDRAQRRWYLQGLVN